MKFASIAALAGVTSAEVYPTAIFHGFGDQCSNSGMNNFTKDIQTSS